MNFSSAVRLYWHVILLLALIPAFGGLYLSVSKSLNDVGHAVEYRLTNSTRLEDASRLQTDFDRFFLALHAYSEHGSDITHDELKLKFDVLWSRVDSLSAARDYEFVQAMDKERTLFGLTKSALKAADPLLQKLRPGAASAVAEIERLFAEVGPRIFDFAQAAYRSRLSTAVEVAEAQRLATAKLSRLQLAFLVIGFGAPLLLSLEVYRVRRLNRSIRQREKQITLMGLTDALTGLGNRRALFEILNSSPSSPEGALLLLDLDGFKAVNDVFGHLVGDALLQQVGKRLIDICAGSGEVFRLGGDEFAIVTHLCTGTACMTAQNVIADLERPFDVEGRDILISASIGIADIAEGDPHSATSPLGNADVALYEAKKDGRHCWRVFTSDLRERTNFQNIVAADLPRAISEGAIRVHYQPQLELKGGRIIGVEALARWTHPTLGEISPDVFVGKAEQLGLIRSLDCYILSKACRDIQKLNRSGADLRLSVNVSPLEAGRTGYCEELLELVTSLRFAKNRLTLELTENTVMEDFEIVAANLTRLAEAGVKIAIDDFGSGYSNLSYLTRFPFSYLKVDRSLAAKTGENVKDQAVLSGVNYIASNLGLTVVLEGIESKQQLDFARHIGAGEVQGYQVARPMSIEDLELFLREQGAQKPETSQRRTAA